MMRVSRPQNTLQRSAIAVLAALFLLASSSIAILLGGGVASASVARTQNTIPAYPNVAGTWRANNSVEVLCQATESYGCVSGSGYNASVDNNGQWPGNHYGLTPGGQMASQNPGTQDWHNCTLYAAFRLQQNGVSNIGNLGNASNWASAAPAGDVNQTPSVGAIAQWNGYGTGGAQFGHVAYVENVTSSYITISEDNYVPSNAQYFPGGYTAAYRINYGSPDWPDNFIHFAVSGSTGSNYPNGTFVRTASNGAVYVIAGGAPIYVSTWSAFGGPQPFVDITSAQLGLLPQVPANGTFIRGAQSGEVYVIAGGAPIYVSTWSAFGGLQPFTNVDQVAIDNAGNGGLWSHLNFTPANGTFIRGAQTGAVYQVIGGMPSYVSSWSLVGGPQPFTNVDQVAIDNAGNGGLWSHLT